MCDVPGPIAKGKRFYTNKSFIPRVFSHMQLVLKMKYISRAFQLSCPGNQMQQQTNKSLKE